MAGEVQSFSNMVSALPIDKLIGEPFFAMIKASSDSVLAYIDWFNAVCLEPDPADPKLKRMRTVEFTVKSPALDNNGQAVLNTDGTVKTNTILMSQPLAAVVDHPNFGPETLEIELEIEVKTSQMDSTSYSTDTTTETNSSSSRWFWGGTSSNTKTTAKVASKSESVRKTDTSARYSIRATGRARGLPEGMAKTLDPLREIAMKPVTIPTK
jgi:hypothetical protein